MLRKINLAFILIFMGLGLSLAACSKSDDGGSDDQGSDDDDIPVFEVTETVPAGTNSWVVNSITQDETMISDSGIHNWTDANDIIKSFVHTGAGELHVGLTAKAASGNSTIKVTVAGETVNMDLTNSQYETLEVGIFNVTEGYTTIEIQGVQKSGDYFGDITEIKVGGSATSGGVNFVPLSNPHFGRRGPSVHMSYTRPSGKDVQYFYNEVNVTPGEDVLGTFFMTCGHAEGYFGMQVNSNGERRVLFSIWSAYVTDDPNQIPDDYKVTELGSGPGVTVRDFGNEGSGKQSFIDVGWKTGLTYKFLVKGEPSPDVSGSTDYTGYFYNAETSEWMLIASLRRPQTSKYLTNTHSFLENFHESTGHLTRSIEFGNQWAYATDGNWYEMTEGYYTADATAANGDRLDYAGGVSGSKFFLKNCGFFDESVAPNTTFNRTANGTAPNIDFESLPQPAGPISVTLADRSGWSATANSEESGGGEGTTGLVADILDGDINTYWHSCWTCSPAAQHPHEIVIDMGADKTLDGLQFVQRQNLSRAIKDFEVQISSDGTNYSSVGNFTVSSITAAQNVAFSQTQTTRYLKIIITSSHDGDIYAALAEVNGYTID